MNRNLNHMSQLAIRLDPSLLMDEVNLTPDPWQRSVLRSTNDRILILCARQTGKSTTTAILGLYTAIFEPDSLVLLLAPSQRQSGELYRKMIGFYNQLDKPVPALQETATTLFLGNGSRILCLPGSADTIRCFSSPRLVIIDEAALTEDDLYVAVNPMLGVGRGRFIALSTPMGQRGWFYDAWETPRGPWERVSVTAEDCPRIAPHFLAEQRQLLGDRWFRQEYLCSFEETIDQVFTTESVLAAFCSTKPPLFEPTGTPPAPDTTSNKVPLYRLGG
jgi:hypothetical protein